ncbi:putative AraC family transcriptional regulator [Kineosphaera limosa NBRC 100340]|uniref:Putative AraC family transcriptional regulator n=2 Tax=Kineosphaera TaxID=211469 RepID=K6WCK7_9MICO|nr:AraC family transcriptional regulator [Kineosphaera limosa]GAB97005.1 putative AraC family transcriptional regulator [Kineosphaera limosa NBRC 100340]
MLALVNELTTTMFCLKDAQSRYVAVNATFVQRTNVRSQRQVLGRTATELFVPELAERYEEQDGQVLATGRPLRNELELIRPPGGVARWYLTAKHPLVHEGATVGLVSISQDLGNDDVRDVDMVALGRVLEFIEDHLDGPIRVPQLAQVAGWGADALERRVRRAFHRSPGQLVLTARIDRARTLLTRSDAPLAQIALDVGFYDQAAFSRTFARLTGQTPSQFRRAGRT